ncbi:N-acetyltransferase [Salinibacterium sp. UTAS2018]|uniref:GNAT family N-acetyltransferase n=1 Tax=unclassified Salinibacterium TaxID=2632331 RepID=UPI0010094EC0|nr:MULTISPECIES: GNAT family N-acetyltransferase [unclassified Salinibacterium]MBH0009388.1 N-acetyltransferase [Salinibacterium sp. SWN1162]QAV69398.1 N-acetyltransferase [Salinibacterium sp. UTAS2018]
MATDFIHEKDADRYVMNVDGLLVAVADYRTSDTAISFNHTYTQPAHRGKGYAAQLMKFAVDDVESTTSLKIVPMCWYVAEWFDRNPERAELLTR